MAAKLEWEGTHVMLGPFRLGQVVDVINMTPRAWRFVLGGSDASGLSEPYESIVERMAACESEVRRLLRDAGVDVA